MPIFSLYSCSIYFYQTQSTGMCKIFFMKIFLFPAVLLQSIKKWKEKLQREKEERLKKKEKSEKIVERLQYEEDQMQKAEERRRQQAAISAWKKQKAENLQWSKFHN